MMIKLNPKIKKCLHFEPPIPVTRYFDDVDTDAPVDGQIESLLWVPALLVSRFLGQFPFLSDEADELFSIGMLKVCEIVNEGKHSGDKIGAVCNVACRRVMEEHCNNLNSVVKICTTTRYKNRRSGIRTPRHQRLNLSSSPDIFDTDDMIELVVRDAAKALGLDFNNMTVQDRRRLQRALA